jgi:hypothetical protein
MVDFFTFCHGNSAQSAPRNVISETRRIRARGPMMPPNGKGIILPAF